MSLFDRLFGSADQGSGSRDPSNDHWFDAIPKRASAAGVRVTAETALAAPVVFDCLTVLSQSVASLPWGVFERLENGDKRRVDRHPVAVLLANPDGESTSHEWFGQMTWDLASAGNAVHEIEPGPLGFASRLPRVQPKDVAVERLEDRSRRWTFTENGRTRRRVEGEVWHLRDLPLVDGLVGLGRIGVGREAIGSLLAVQEYGARHFENDAVPPVVVEHPSNFADQASRENFLREIGRFFGLKRRGPAVLEFGMKLQRLATTNEESQFLETRKELQLEVARLWRMPPHKIGALERATNNNIEHQSIEFVTDTLAPWLDLIESSINRTLFLNPRRFFFEFNVAGLLRGDIKARYEAYAQARQWGWLSVNEIRRLENLNPIGTRGDQYLQPLNMTPAGSPGAAASTPRLLSADGSVHSEFVAGEWRSRHAA
ncbi:MAG: phage portal protein [Pseudomonadota bacterium]|nr:phage portal protein [Pseudomonadota bacterium]